MPITIDLSIENSTVKTSGDMPKETGTKRPDASIHLPPVTSETQATINAPIPDKPVYAETKIEDRDISLRGGADAAETNITNTGKVENSEEKIKMGYIREHFTYIRDIIMRNLSYPQVARKMGWTGKVKISFIVCSDGHAKDIKIAEGSGIEMLDKNAVEAVKKASPFPRPPLEAHLIIPIVYKLN
jgi:TonB family protein